MKLAVVGATGLVGKMMLKVLEESSFPISTLIPVASEKSIGQQVAFQGKNIPVIGIRQAISLKPNIALFSAGSQVSLLWAPEFASAGCRVIDNSSAWRMDPEKKLVVPEINAGVITASDFIIANPNCSTIQMVMVLQPLHQLYQIKRVVVSTYQSVSGTGVKAVNQLLQERKDNKEISDRAYAYPIDLNLIPQIDVFMDNGYTKEEMKMVNETRKIMKDNNIRISATAVRVPVLAGHSESVNIEFENPISIKEIKEALQRTPGIKVYNEQDSIPYPMPILAANNDLVHTGRIRRDESVENGVNLWIVSDNLRKGAASNAIQIARYLVDKGFTGN